MSIEDRDRLRALSNDPDWQQAITKLYARAQLDVIPQAVSQVLSQAATQATQLRAQEQQYINALDQYKLILGLPTDLQLTINNRMLKQFELIDPRLFEVERDLLDYREVHLVPIDTEDPDLQRLRAALARMNEIREQLQTKALDIVAHDFDRVDAVMPERIKELTTTTDREAATQNLERNRLVFREVLIDSYQQSSKELDEAIEAVSQPEVPVEARQEALKTLYNAREDLLQVAQNLQSVQSSIRAELVTLQDFDFTQEQAVALALENRLDLMNFRASVMDARRQLEVAANRLEATLNLVTRGDIQNSVGNKPFDFRGPRSTFQAGIQFTAPLDQVLVRNNYRTAQINYQRARRAYIDQEDRIKLQIRTEWRTLQQLKANLETTRQNLRISAINLDTNIENFNQPAQATQVGQTGGGQQNQNQGLALIQALGNVLTAQNNLISIWVQYEQNRINIYRDMDIMQVDERGLWIDPVYQNLPASDAVLPASFEPTHDYALLFTNDLVDCFLGHIDEQPGELGGELFAAPVVPVAAEAGAAGDPVGTDWSGVPLPRGVVAQGASARRAVDALPEIRGAEARGSGAGAREARPLPDHGGGAWHPRQHEERGADQ